MWRLFQGKAQSQWKSLAGKVVLRKLGEFSRRENLQKFLINHT